MARTQKKAQLEQRTLVLIDESGFYLLPAIVKSYAPCGCTPILRVFQTRDHWSVMSAITPEGHLFTMGRDYAMTGRDSMWFLKHWRWRCPAHPPGAMAPLRARLEPG